MRRRVAFRRALVPHFAGNGAVEYSSRERRRTFPWQEALLLGTLVGLIALAYALLTAEVAPAPALSLLAPAADATIPGGVVKVIVQAHHADRLLAREGVHFHYYLDVEPPTAPGRPALTASASCVSTNEASHTWTIVGSGWHRLSVQLVRANDTPLSPPVLATVSVRVPATTSASGAAAGQGGTPVRSGGASPTKPNPGGGC